MNRAIHDKSNNVEDTMPAVFKELFGVGSMCLCVLRMRRLPVSNQEGEVAGCIEQMKYEILLKNATFKQTLKYISEHADEVYYVEPGFKVFDRRLIGVPPVPVGVGASYIMLTYVKPCHGSFVLKLPRDDDEVDRIIAEDKEYKSKRKAKRASNRP